MTYPYCPGCGVEHTVECSKPTLCLGCTEPEDEPRPKTLSEEIEQVNRFFGPKCRTCGGDLPDGGVTGYCSDCSPDRIAELREKWNYAKDAASRGRDQTFVELFWDANHDINELLDKLNKYREEYSREKYYEGKRRSVLHGEIRHLKDEIKGLQAKRVPISDARHAELREKYGEEGAICLYGPHGITSEVLQSKFQDLAADVRELLDEIERLKRE